MEFDTEFGFSFQNWSLTRAIWDLKGIKQVAYVRNSMYVA